MIKSGKLVLLTMLFPVLLFADSFDEFTDILNDLKKEFETIVLPSAKAEDSEKLIQKIKTITQKIEKIIKSLDAKSFSSDKKSINALDELADKLNILAQFFKTPTLEKYKEADPHEIKEQLADEIFMSKAKLKIRYYMLKLIDIIEFGRLHGGQRYKYS